MNLKNIIAVSGLPNLTMLVSTKNNGLLLKDFKTEKINFYSVRSHQFTPLETVGIYTMTDTVDLKEVFKSIKDKMESHPIVSPKSNPQELSQYFAHILPDFDRDRVYPSDIKKVIKWYKELDELGFLNDTNVEIKTDTEIVK
jgi:hypothetical protein